MFLAENNIIYKLDQLTEKYIEVCQGVEIEEVMTDVISYEKIVRLKLFLSEGEVFIEIPRKNFVQKEIIQELLKRGLSINVRDVNALISYLFQCEKGALQTYYHTQLGFHPVKGSLVYLASQSVGGDVDSFSLQYDRMQPKGNEESWLKLIETEVIGHPALELVLVIGYSAMLVGRLSHLIGYSNLLILLHNETSSGKTTALKLMASIYGNPDIGKRGIIGTLDTTDNALIDSVCDKNGFPILLDEAMIEQGKNWSNLIYRMEAGSERARLNQDITARQLRSWNTTIIMTSESSMLENSSNHGGLNIRLFEIKKAFTDSAEHSNRILRGISAHHGYGFFDFAGTLLNSEEEVLASLYNRRKEMLCNRVLHKNALTIRIMEKLAVLSATAVILKKMIKINIDVDAIDNEIIAIHDEIANRRELDDEALQYFKQWLLENKNNFDKEAIYRNGQKNHSLSKISVGNTFGKIYTDEGGTIFEVVISTKKLREVFSNTRFPSPTVIFKAWKNKNIIINCDAGRLDTKRTISGISTRVYIIQFPKEDATTPSDNVEEAKSVHQDTEEEETDEYED